MSDLDSFDLGVVEQAYGPDADLYVDVLKVADTATSAEIQAAYFERREEIYGILKDIDESRSGDLSYSQKRFAEKRMDAVVMAFRVLRDPTQCQWYRRERAYRLQRRASCVDQRDESIMNAVPESLLQSKDINKPPSPARKTNSSKKKAEVTVKHIPKTAHKARADAAAALLSSRTRHFMMPPQLLLTDGDPGTISSSGEGYARQIYRVEKLSRQKMDYHNSNSSVSSRSTRHYDSGDCNSVRELPPRTSRRKKSSGSGSDSLLKSARDKRKALTRKGSKRRSRKGGIMSESEDSVSVYSRVSRGGDSVVSRIRESRIVRAVTEEVHGTYLDTFSAFDQVLNAFTLQDEDIDAVCGRIDQARRQLGTC